MQSLSLSSYLCNVRQIPNILKFLCREAQKFFSGFWLLVFFAVPNIFFRYSSIEIFMDPNLEEEWFIMSSSVSLLYLSHKTEILSENIPLIWVIQIFISISTYSTYLKLCQKSAYGIQKQCLFGRLVAGRITIILQIMRRNT